MTVKAVREAIELVRNGDPTLCWFVGECSESLIVEAEDVLGLEYPESYRLFLQELGAGGVGAEEIYGVTPGGFVNSSIPNGVWLTLEARREWGLPSSMVVIYFDGGVDYYVLDCKYPDPLVSIWRPGVSSSNDELSTVHENFGSFFLRTVQDELGDGCVCR